jgi:Uma2 family endonuclease
MPAPVATLDDEPLRPLKRVEYMELARRGFFDDERVELLFGAVVPVAPPDFQHAMSVSQLMKLLVLRIGDRATIFCQTTFAASDISAPEPDVFVFPTREGWGGDNPDRAYLVIEVARTSLRRDRAIKTKLYALASVDEYWIVNHVDGVIEVYRDRQSDGSWRTCTFHQRGDSVALLSFPDVTITVDDVVPPLGS